jgi:two-component system chemotaxis sensor kinase CheA
VLEPRFAVPPDNAPIFQEFLGEAPQLLETMEGALLQLGQQAPAKEPVDAVMRSLHTLKGIFGFLGLEAMAELCHRGEDALGSYQGQPHAIPTEPLQWMLQVLDAIRAQVECIGADLSSGSFALIDLGSLGATPQDDSPSQDAVAAPATERGSEASQDRFLRIRVEKMDALLELVGEIAICQSQVGEGLRLQQLPPALASEVGRLAKISRELQETVLSLRLVPVEPLMLRASRVAYDIAQKTGKAIDFSCEGRDTELDKRMVEELSEPLLHLIRNAVDHGLEPAEARLDRGKPLAGRLQLRASHQGGDFLLELEDDGRGLDLARLAAKGRSLGFLAAGDELDEARVTDLIFQAGFSTAEAVTDISGRGVGLDAVRSRIQALKGDIQVSSRPGLGCRFSIRLPLTMALVEGILVRVGESRYVLPAIQVRKFSALDAAQSHRLGDGREWLECAGQSLPVIDLGSALGTSASGEGRRVALHVESLGHQATLIVDEVLGKQQVVAKGLGASLQHLHGVAGGAILADGKVSLILDLEALMGRERATAAA